MNIKIKIMSMVMCLFAIQAVAVPTLGEYWGSGIGNMVNPSWNAVDLVGSIPSSTGVGAVGSQSVTLTFPSGGISPYASLSTTQANYLGNYASLGKDLTISFRFNPIDYPPNSFGGLGMYFSNNGNIWYANVTTPLTLGQQFYSVNVGSVESWTADIGNLANWTTAFQNVQEIGFTILGANQNSLQRYNFSDISLSDMSLNVPEPETLWLILAVLVSLAATFRRFLIEFLTYSARFYKKVEILNSKI